MNPFAFSHSLQTQALDLKQILSQLLLDPEQTLQELPGGLWQWELPASQIASQIAQLVQNFKARLLTLLASDQRSENGAFWLHAALYFGDSRQTLLLKAAVPDDLRYPALSPLLPQAEWHEREMHDLFGILPQGMSLDPLVLHRDWPRTQHPLRKDFLLQTAVPVHEAPHVFDFHEPAGSHQVAVGPIHAGIIEPGHLRFCVTGEQIHQFSAQLFYTHKGLEKLAEGKSWGDGLILAENTCAQCALSHSVAYSQALENLAGVVLPARALALRSLGLELERLANHGADLSAMAAAGGFGFASAQMADIREQLMRLNKRLSGHRFFRGWNAPGGFSSDVPADVLTTLETGLKVLRGWVDEWIQLVTTSSGFLDRLEGTGILSQEEALRLGLVGFAARACGIARDVRLDRPYAAYAQYPPAMSRRTYGDARSRMEIRLDEMQTSFGLIETLLHQLPDGPVQISLPQCLPSGVPALGVVESSRGELVHWLELDTQQNITRWHVRSAAYLNWRGMVQATMGKNIVPDAPLINKSFNLCYACVDR